MKDMIDGIPVVWAKNYAEFKELIIAGNNSFDGTHNVAIDIRTVHYYIRCVELLRREVGKQRHLIFRGHPNADYPLMPSIMRDDIFLWPPSPSEVIEYERKLMVEFKNHARPHISNIAMEPIDEWQWLALAQHHALPTRLLDWTYRPTTALFSP